ncbi:MAG: beta-ketoacyl synthase [Bacteroidia bacterium]|nr:beta-ketoacyl synthase [Bacteroidia bacterium]
MVKIFIGAEQIISPLGNTVEENFMGLKQNISGIKLFEKSGFKQEDVHLAKFTGRKNENKFDDLLENCLSETLRNISPEIITSEKTIIILSTTKGDLEKSLTGTIVNSVNLLQKKFSVKNVPLVVSMACASGVIAIITGANLIRAGIYSHAIIIGCDVISDFVLFGFQSLFAIGSEPCAPYDRDRKGITLGEGAAAVVLSNEKNIFHQEPVEFIHGTSSNDANHISGPSRTGEGLFRTIKKTLSDSKVQADDIDFISAHGTATLYNDDMESIAFDKMGLNDIPLNSFKGYFGHTLGVAGVIETACCLQSMRNNLLIKNYGFKNIGTTKPINVISVNERKEIKTVLKTSSGFGGCNASMVLQKS